MTTSPTTDIQPVIQADIDAALELVSPHEARRIKARTCDDHMLVQAFARHRLTFTTPTLGDMVMVPRAVIREMRLAEADYADAKQGAVERLVPAIDALLSYESAAPASPIPISANGAGERE